MATLIPLACGDQAERSLCAVYADLLATEADVGEIDPTVVSASTAGRAADVAEEYVSAVRRLRAAGDDRYRSAIDDLLTAARDVELTLSSVDAEADFATWSPLVAEDLEDARRAADRVHALIGPQCAPVDDE
jgi:hypothetical protein